MKHSDNAGRRETEDETAAAFSYFTYILSGKFLLNGKPCLPPEFSGVKTLWMFCIFTSSFSSFYFRIWILLLGWRPSLLAFSKYRYFLLRYIFCLFLRFGSLEENSWWCVTSRALERFTPTRRSTPFMARASVPGIWGQVRRRWDLCFLLFVVKAMASNLKTRSISFSFPF